MNSNLTEIVFILDRSGSMVMLTDDTIGGFNSFVNEQKKEPGEVKLTTVLFDDKYEILHNGVNLKDIKTLTDHEYYTRGMTALLDAIGKTIVSVGDRLSKTPESDRPSKILFVITTDGLENDSKEFTFSQVKEMIIRQTDVYNWKFIFLGANIDAVLVGNSIGVSASASYSASSSGTRSLYETVTKVTTQFRSKGTIDNDWDKDIE